jgi:hypothetical protein
MKFGESCVFMDIDNLMAGQRFDQELEKALAQCEVLIAIIGTRWMDLLSQHRRAGGRDYVREEIGAALAREIPVIPVLVGREGKLPAMPRADDLPKDLRNLAYYQKHGVAHESFTRDIGDLNGAVGQILRKSWTSPIAVPRIVVPKLGRVAVMAAAACAAVAIVGAGFWLMRPDAEAPVLASATAKPVALKTKDIVDVLPPRSQGESIQSVLDQNARKMFDYYKNAAEMGDAVAMTKLGSSYEEGNGTARNPQLALVWYQRAADAGNTEAKAKLARMKGKQ